MERKCKVCNQIKKTPYKDICRNCYQKEWQKTIPEKNCDICTKPFNTAGKNCWNCQDKLRKEKSRTIPCLGCKRIGLLIINKKESFCTRCDRQEKEKEDPSRRETRRRQVRESNRRQRGTDIKAPQRQSKGWWKTKSGYILIFKKHPNSFVNGCILQHVFVMSEHMGRPLKKGESVHHINGQRDDNRIENLELWHRSHPSGQRLDQKIEWAKQFLEDYDFDVKIKL